MNRSRQNEYYALLLFNADDQQVDGTLAKGALERVRRVAQSTLRLIPTVAYINIHAYDVLGVMAQQPLEQVNWDQEW